MSLQTEALKRVLSDVILFAKFASGVTLRSYQRECVRAIVDSVLRKRGLTFVVMMSRQAGKNEAQAQLEAYLLLWLSQSRSPSEMVKASPTFKPQTINAMRRIERTLERNLLTHGRWRRVAGYIYELGRASLTFFSAYREASVVGSTASALLSCDEAQDVLMSKWDKDFAPMAASTNATTVFWGTAWTSGTLLARERRVAQAEEAHDGLRRVFVFDADVVGREIPAYQAHVARQVQKFGRNHPLIKTQYYLEEIDAEGGMFPLARQLLMIGRHAKRDRPEVGKLYALLVDVAGEDEDAEGQAVREREPRKDSTALTLVEVDTSTLGDGVLQAPSYKVVQRVLWTGTKHPQLYGRIVALAQAWQCTYVVVDSTGLGAGLASFLGRALPERVIPYVFSYKSKSELGFGFLAVIDSGRFHDYADDDELKTQFYREAAACAYTIREGAGKAMSWGVPDGTRDVQTGELLHDDLLISASLCWVLDAQVWPLGMGTLVIQGKDPLKDMERGF